MGAKNSVVNSWDTVESNIEYIGQIGWRIGQGATKFQTGPKQSQKTQGFLCRKFWRHYLTKEGRVRKSFYCLIWIKEPCVRKFEGLTRSKILWILQTDNIVV